VAIMLVLVCSINPLEGTRRRVSNSPTPPRVIASQSHRPTSSALLSRHIHTSCPLPSHSSHHRVDIHVQTLAQSHSPGSHTPSTPSNHRAQHRCRRCVSSSERRRTRCHYHRWWRRQRRRRWRGPGRRLCPSSRCRTLLFWDGRWGGGRAGRSSLHIGVLMWERLRSWSGCCLVGQGRGSARWVVRGVGARRRRCGVRFGPFPSDAFAC
jgi:hypothetical protein